MPSGTNSFYFLFDFKSIADCLFSIQTAADSGAFLSDAEAQKRLYAFENDLIRKLYNQTLRLLGSLEGISAPGRQFLEGDFDKDGFLESDFYTGYLDTRNNGFSSRFQTVLNILADLKDRQDSLSTLQKLALDSTLEQVTDAFEELRAYLRSKGLDTCLPGAGSSFNNSSSLYLQAAGSDGSDGTPPGIYLRWNLAGELGDTHLPQGAASAGSSGQNPFIRPEDKVYLSRTPYINAPRQVLDFETARPVINYSRRQWTYTLTVSSGEKHFTNRLRLTFSDSREYKQQSLENDPADIPFEFLKSYQGFIRAELLGELAYFLSIDFRAAGNYGSLKLKVISSAAAGTADTQAASIYKTVEAGGDTPQQTEIWGDNMRYILFKKTGDSWLQSISFETYHLFLNSRPENAWTALGNGFGLSLNDQDVFQQLERPAYPVDNLWPQFNGGAKVRVANYQDKWLNSYPDDPSLKAMVQQYLNLSLTDARASFELGEENADPDDPAMTLSALDLLNLMALDYHIARMLGMGYIYTGINSAAGQRFVYRIRYTNRPAADTGISTFEHLSLPTGLGDSRLPLQPDSPLLSYKLPVSTESGNDMFDEAGYAAKFDTRLVNISRRPFAGELGDDLFFTASVPAADMNFFEHSRPVLYGIEYRPDSQSSFVKPEITSGMGMNDDSKVYYAYDDTNPANGIPETTPVPDNPESLFVHFEEETGIHHYAIYGINWFARSSPLSELSSTDPTVFAKKNTVLPVTDVAVQLVQAEDPRLFTTLTEQNWISGRKNSFPALPAEFTRITFNLLDITDVSFVKNTSALQLSDIVKATEAKVYFRSRQPIELKGVITDMLDGPTEKQLVLETGSYSLPDGTAAVPVIEAAYLPNFRGSLLSSGGESFRVVSVTNGSTGPVFTIEKALGTETIEDDEEPGAFGAHEYFIMPGIGERFSVVENLNDPDNWLPLENSIQIVDLSPGHTPDLELSYDQEGNESKYLIGGITAPAIITALKDAESGLALPGYYNISFSAGTSLPPHPQVNLPFDPANPDATNPAVLQPPHVEWYKGLVRVPVGTAPQKKLLEVLHIVRTNPISINVFDPGFEDENNSLPVSETQPLTGVNFHPGYRAYIFPEPGKAFAAEAILPGAEETEKRLLIGLQTVDSGLNGSGFSSAVSTPVVMLSRKPEELITPEVVVPFDLLVRPNPTGKAAFTFDIRIAERAGEPPFGFAFYRTSLTDMLNVLYKPETVQQIYSDLNALTVDEYRNNRFLALANQVFDPPESLQYKIFEAQPLPYGFPEPDKPGLITADMVGIQQKKDRYSLALMSTLLPLTPQIPMYAFLKEGLLTENKAPVLNTGGQSYPDPLTPGFDPFPMVRKFNREAEAGLKNIRFTDYSLNASSRQLYFYTAAEASARLVIGTPGPFAGPVKILDIIPPPAPVVRSFRLEEIAEAGSPLSVTFQLSLLPGNTDLSKVRIYRTASEARARSAATMDTWMEVEISENAGGAIEISDSFTDFDAAPMGQTLYYRLSSIRTIINEEGLQEDIESVAGEIIPVRIIDTLNPPAPELEFEAGDNSLNWQLTTWGGSYHLYKQNRWGNWQKIASLQPPETGDQIKYILDAPLALTDEDGDRIYHRFKVKVENSSGLMNLEDKELTI